MIETAAHPAESAEFLSRLHDGELDPGEAAAFEAHRAECDACRAAVAEFERALSVYREAPVAPVASDLSARILRKIRATSPSRRPFGVMFGIDVRWAGLLAAALLVVIIGAPVFSRRPATPAPAGNATPGPIPAYVLDAEEARAAEKIKEAPPPKPRRAAPEPAAPPPGTQSRAPERGDEPASAIAAPEAERDEAGARTKAADAGVPATPPTKPDLAREPAAEGTASLRAQRQNAPAPAPVRLTIRAIDGQGTAPGLAGAPSDERLAAFRGEEFVLVVESGGRVRAVERRPADKKLAKDEGGTSSAPETPASAEPAEVVLRELVFHPGDRSRRLTVAVH